MGERRARATRIILRPAIFLDRDGVLNEPVVRAGKPYPPDRLADVVVCDGAVAALAELRAAGFVLICVTNQPDIARGTMAARTVDAINQRLSDELALDDVIVCPHDDRDGCACRKPKPGLLEEGSRRHGIDLRKSYLVGDRWRDIEAGASAHCRTVFVDRGYAERGPATAPDARVANVAQAAKWIIADARSHMQQLESLPLATSAAALKIKLFADGADLKGIAALAALAHIAGFTTNPTLMRNAGVTDYADFGRKALAIVGTRPISFEVFADEPREMLRHARELASWGDNVYVKIPVTDTKGTSMAAVVRELTAEGVRTNVTALMTETQVAEVCTALEGTRGAYVSVFAGRIADTGRDPIPLMRRNAALCSEVPNVELIWASPRELLNVFQADAAGVHVITATPDILAKLPLVGKDLTAYSRETVVMFHRDAQAAGFTL
jgi:transaldolase